MVLIKDGSKHISLTNPFYYDYKALQYHMKHAKALQNVLNLNDVEALEIMDWTFDTNHKEEIPF